MKGELFDVCFVFHVDYNYVDELRKNDISSILGSIFFTLHDLLPNLPITIAPSGSFIEWAKMSDSPFIYWLKDMAMRGQVELLGGAFYEPFFSIIPFNDLLGQLELLTEVFRDEFGKKPHGCFLPVSAWVEGVIEPLKKAGMSYCLLDSRLFHQASLRIYEPASIEHNGKTIFAIPLESSLSAINEISPEDFYKNLLNLSQFNNSCLNIPVTKEVLNACLIERNGTSWFKQFLALIKDSPINITHVGKTIKTKRTYQQGIISSNAILSGKVINTSIKKSIFIEPSLSNLYSKIFYVHSICNQVRGDKARKKAALQDLWKAESSIFFNLERKNSDIEPMLFQSAYRHLLLAEKQARTQGIFSTSLLSYDFNMDGIKEFLFQTENMNMYIHNVGGKVFELDIFSVYKNYTYIGEEHSIFLDHLVGKDDIQNILSGNDESITTRSVFANNFYQDVSQDKINMCVKFESAGIIENSGTVVSLKKIYNMTNDGMQLQYFLKNDSKNNLLSNFMMEISLAFDIAGKKRSKLTIYSEEIIKEIPAESFCKNLTFLSVPWVQLQGIDNKIRFMIELNEEGSVILIPIYKKYAETKVENIVGIRLLFYWSVMLQPGRDTEKTVFFKIFDSKKKRKGKKICV